MSFNTKDALIDLYRSAACSKDTLNVALGALQSIVELEKPRDYGSGIGGPCSPPADCDPVKCDPDTCEICGDPITPSWPTTCDHFLDILSGLYEQARDAGDTELAYSIVCTLIEHRDELGNPNFGVWL